MQKLFSATILAAAAAFALTACGGGDDDPAPTPGPTPTPTPTPTAILPANIDFDALEELLRPGATVPLQVELEDAAGRDVSDPAAANVQVSILSDGSGGAHLSASQLATVRGDANFTITLGASLGTVIVQASTDRSDNNVANGIADELSWLLGMVVTQTGDGLNWELPAVVNTAAGASVRLEDADDGFKPRSYAISGAAAAGMALAPCGDDVCLSVPTGTAAGSYSATFTVTDATGATLAMPVTVVVR